MGDWYKSFYLTTPEGEAKLRVAIQDPANLADVKKRLEEFTALPKGRCIISDTQVEFLEKIIKEGL